MMRNAISRKAIVLFTLGVGALALWAWFFQGSCTGDGRESFRDKFEWSVLQALEARHRGSPISAVEFTEQEGCRIICVPTTAGERLWILLNPQSPPFYKQMPEGNYSLSKAELSDIVRTHRPISTVEECLSSHVRRQP